MQDLPLQQLPLLSPRAGDCLTDSGTQEARTTTGQGSTLRQVCTAADSEAESAGSRCTAALPEMRLGCNAAPPVKLPFVVDDVEPVRSRR